MRHADGLLTPAQAAALISDQLRPMSVYTLKRRTRDGTGPQGIHDVRDAPTRERPYYDPAEVARWIAANQPPAASRGLALLTFLESNAAAGERWAQRCLALFRADQGAL